MTRLSRWSKGVIVSLLSVGFTLALLEGGLRVFHLWRFGIPLLSQPSGNLPLVLDPGLGWRANENFAYIGRRVRADGTQYHIRATQLRDGFKKYGNLQSPKPRVLVLGDSFTQAVEVSNEKTYFAFLGNQTGAEVFAYGAGGYGTLQEYMILDRYIDRLTPQVIVWQFTSNDFINNSLELEMLSTQNNNGMARPYLIDGRIQLVIPRRNPRLTAMVLASRLGMFTMGRIDRMLARTASVENRIEAEGARHEGFRRAAAITEEILRRARARAGGARILAFSVDDTEPYYSEFRRIARRNGILFVDEVPDAVRREEKRGVVTRTEDLVHWNEIGHRICGQALSRYVAEQVSFASPNPSN
jgi:hypothetical protein